MRRKKCLIYSFLFNLFELKTFKVRCVEVILIKPTYCNILDGDYMGNKSILFAWGPTEKTSIERFSVNVRTTNFLTSCSHDDLGGLQPAKHRHRPD